MRKVSLGDILENILIIARQDGIITEDEERLIHTINLELEEIEKQVRELTSDIHTRLLLSRLLNTSGKELVGKVLSRARDDAVVSQDERIIIQTLLQELDIDASFLESRPWFVFKICISLRDEDNVDVLLRDLDRILCLRGLDPSSVYSGLCLGTKHYVIGDVDVTLLAFATTPDTTSEWVYKGAFATIKYEPDKFTKDLRRTAEHLIDQNYFSKN